ncbi:MAG: hypothetical protein GEU79_10480 [Acidimicrobiia bacterium]|nr:hypothetical protein [Acidimicrobiia bacterium]
MRKLVFLATIAMLAVIATAQVASADESCTGTIGAVTIGDNVVVPNGATCTLNGTTVEGDVKVEPNARVNVLNGAYVDGNIQTDDGGASYVNVRGSEVDGDIQVFDSSRATVNNTTVGGNVQYENNDGNLAVTSSDVDGDVQVNDNDGGNKEIRGNTIGGNLQCEGNEPAPNGGNNTVQGDAEGQCADLDDGNPPPSSTTTTSPTTTTIPDDDDDDDRFEDVDDDNVFEDDIERLAESGITVGCNPPENDLFCPNDDVERQQMAAFLVRALDLPAGSADFDDVDDDNVFGEDISALADAGITLGCNPPENDLFCPDDDVERQQMAAFLVRALDLPAGSADFDDVSDDNVFAEDIAALADAGITVGCNPPDNTQFCPDDDVERGQMAAFLVRAGLTD